MTEDSESPRETIKMESINELDNHIYRRHTSSALRQISSQILTVVLTSMVWWLYFDLTQPLTDQSSSLPSTRTLHCGKTTTEARVLGCVYDPLAIAWVPEPCYDPQTTREYQASVQWRGYNDSTGEELLDIEEMSERTGYSAYYTTAREHAVHCAFIWQRQHKLYARGALNMDMGVIDYLHTVHCANMLIMYADSDPSELEKLSTKTHVGLSSCRVAI